MIQVEPAGLCEGSAGAEYCNLACCEKGGDCGGTDSICKASKVAPAVDVLFQPNSQHKTADRPVDHVLNLPAAAPPPYGVTVLEYVAC